MLKNFFWNSQENRLRALWRLVLQFAMLILASVAAVTAVAFAFPELLNSAMNNPDNGSSKMFMVLLQLVPMALSVWLAGRFLDRRKFSDFGFHINRSWLIDLAFGMALGAFLMGAIFLVEWSAGWVQVTGVFEGTGSTGSFWLSLAASFAMFVAVGFQEELFSRGYQLTNIAEMATGLFGSKKVALVVATLASSAAFGLLHVFNPAASTTSTVNIMIAGITLATGYLLTGELAIPIGLHITWNFFQGSVFGFPVSGNVLPPSIITIQQGGNPAMTGGAFGPEAGWIGVAAMVVGVIAIAAWVKFRTGKLTLAIKTK